MNNRAKLANIAALLSTALIVTLLVIHHRANLIHPNRHTLPVTAQQAAQAKQTARDFFDALGKGDWDKIAGLCPPGYPLGDALSSEQKDYFKDLQVLSLGEPFKQPPYSDIYVPYRIRFRDGEEKEFNLAVRNDNAKQKWYFDGGF